MVRIAAKGESRILAEMAVQMWDRHTVDELETEFVETMDDKKSCFFYQIYKGSACRICTMRFED